MSLSKRTDRSSLTSCIRHARIELHSMSINLGQITSQKWLQTYNSTPWKQMHCWNFLKSTLRLKKSLRNTASDRQSTSERCEWKGSTLVKLSGKNTILLVRVSEVHYTWTRGLTWRTWALESYTRRKLRKMNAFMNLYSKWIKKWQTSKKEWLKQWIKSLKTVWVH